MADAGFAGQGSGREPKAISSSWCSKHLLENLFVERMDQNEEIFCAFYLNDASFQKGSDGPGWPSESIPAVAEGGL